MICFAYCLSNLLLEVPKYFHYEYLMMSMARKRGYKVLMSTGFNQQHRWGDLFPSYTSVSTFPLQ